MMKVKLLIASCLFLSASLYAQKSHKWKLDSYQLNVGGVISTKIPSASYDYYYSTISNHYDSLIWWESPKSLTNLKMRPLYNGNLQFINSKTNAIQRFGFSLNSRLLTSFLTQYIVPVDTAYVPEGSVICDIRLDHTSPVFTFDYAYLRKIELSKQLDFNFGVGTYIGFSLGNKISTLRTNADPWGNVYSGGGYSRSDILTTSVIDNFSKHNFNLGIYASFGLEYSLHEKQVENQRWFITYENRICYDFFAVKNVPSSWFSFQSANMFGLKYYLNRK
jgi:hypothetical protein